MWHIIDHLLDFNYAGYSELEVFTPTQYRDAPDYIKAKSIASAETCSSIYAIYNQKVA